MRHLPGKFVRYCRTLEDGLLVLLLAVMIVMATVQILLRNLFSTGLVWNESFLRVLVLWITLVGAMVATRGAEHIRIDVLQRYLPPALLPWLARCANFFSAVICTIACRYSVSYVYLEYSTPYPAFANVPSWVPIVIIPFGFAVMALRFFWQAWLPVAAAGSTGRQ